MLDTDVLVVGAGPVGLMLAGELRLAGAGVIVLEQRATPTTESRATTVHARTMEILDSRGLREALGVPPCEPRGHFGGLPLDLSGPSPWPSPWPGQWKVPQTRLEELLQQWAIRLGADVRRGHEVRDIAVSEQHVEVTAIGAGGATVRLRAGYLVGCDGQDSTVRGLSGIEFAGWSAGRELLRADVAGVDIPDRRFERLPGGLAVAARRGDGVTRVMVHELGGTVRPRSAAPSFEEVVARWRRVTGEDLSGGTPVWLNAFDDTNRQVVRYRAGRILLAGDAAHQQLPVGGQALNLGVQDAVNLGWKLAAQVAGTAPDGLLDSYHDERHAVGRRVLLNIRSQATLLFGGPEVEPVRTLLGDLMASPDVRAALAAMISGLDIRYDVGPGNHPLLGRRLPSGNLCGQTEAAGVSRGARGLLLGPSRGSALWHTAQPWADRVAVVSTAGHGEPLDGTAAVLVRPDGHVVWADGGTPPLQDALHRWFGCGTTVDCCPDLPDAN